MTNDYRIAPPGFTEEQWETFLRDGIITIENALSPDDVQVYLAAIDRVWVSTDDAATARLARVLGAEAPFLRPAALADDHAPLVGVIAHALEEARTRGLAVSHACLVYATAPMVDPADMARGHDTLLARGADFALAVAPCRFPPQRAQRIDAEGRLHYLMPQHRESRSQDLEPCWHDAAQFVWGTAAAFLGEIAAPVTVAVPLDGARVVDIDTPEDWRLAERLFALEREAAGAARRAA